MSHLNPDRQVLLAHIGFDRRIVRAEGDILFDSEGKHYLDCLAQYGALPFGHNPACLWAAVEQARLAREPSLVQPLIAPAAEELAARLVQVAPCDDGYVTFTNSGAEAVEAAIKLARARTRRPVILGTHQGFHGKTLGGVSATGTAKYRAPFLVRLHRRTGTGGGRHDHAARGLPGRSREAVPESQSAVHPRRNPDWPGTFRLPVRSRARRPGPGHPAASQGPGRRTGVPGRRHLPRARLERGFWPLPQLHLCQ